MTSTASADPGFAPVATIDGNDATGILLLCDHASNRLPPLYGTLGLPASELERHIGYDIGAEAVTRALAARLGAPGLLTTFSRLLIDPNRGEDDPTLVMRLSDGAVVPGNARADAAERDLRIARFHRPYHDAIAAKVAAMAADGRAPLVIAIHSFTPVWRGWPRPWHVGILWDADPRGALPFIAMLRRDDTLVVGDNEPYDGALKGDTLYRHATAHGYPHALVEIRQDLIADESGAAGWAERLAPIIEALRRDPETAEIRRFGSRTGPLAGDD